MTRREFQKWLLSTASFLLGSIYKGNAYNFLSLDICEKSHLLPTENCPKLTRIFVEGREPKEYCNIRQKRRAKPAKLIIRGKKLYYKNGGTVPITPIGCSPRQLLHSELGLAPPIKYSLEEEITLWLEFGTNYCRVDAVEDYDLTYEFCQRMEKKNIIVELTLADHNRPHFGDYRIHVEKTRALRNVIYEVENEFLDDRSRIFAAKLRAESIASQGLITSAGAWGRSSYGKRHSKEFRTVCDCYKIETIHRPYPPLAGLKKHVKYLSRQSRPILWNEVLVNYKDIPSIPSGEVEKYVYGALKAGVSGINIYNDDFIEVAGKLCKAMN